MSPALRVLPAALGTSAAGVERVLNVLDQVWVPGVVTQLAAALPGGAVDADQGSLRTAWRSELSTQFDDLADTAQALRQAESTYVAAETRIGHWFQSEFSSLFGGGAQ